MKTYNYLLRILLVVGGIFLIIGWVDYLPWYLNAIMIIIAFSFFIVILAPPQKKGWLNWLRSYFREVVDLGLSVLHLLITLPLMVAQIGIYLGAIAIVAIGLVLGMTYYNNPDLTNPEILSLLKWLWATIGLELICYWLSKKGMRYVDLIIEKYLDEKAVLKFLNLNK